MPTWRQGPSEAVLLPSRKTLVVTPLYINGLHDSLVKKLVPTDDVVVGGDMAFAPGMQFNLRFRQEWDMSNGNLGHAQLQFTHSADSYSDIMEPNKARQDSYTYMDVEFRFIIIFSYHLYKTESHVYV